MMMFRPDAILAVPLVLDKFNQQLLASRTYRALKRCHLTAVIKPIIRKRFGGNLKTIICGGAALDSHLAKIFTALGMEVFQGYGLTELSPLISTNTQQHNREESVGRPIPGVDVKIGPRKTLLVNSPGLFQGYFEEDNKKNKRPKDGWFDTGDIAEIKDGFIYIKGRYDDCVSLQNGKKIYLSQIEASLEAKGIYQACMHAHGNSLTALIYDTRKSDEEVNRTISEMNRELINSTKIQGFARIPDPFRIEDGTLTPTMKKRRGVILNRYAYLVPEPK